MQRRKFLKLTGLGAAMLALPGVGAAAVSVEQAVVGILINEFDYLKLDQKGVEQFVADYFKARPNIPTMVKLKAKSYYLLKLKSPDSPLVAHYAEEYISATDFFLNRMDESKTVNYLGLYNPWKRPCANPFSKIYYPTGNIS